METVDFGSLFSNFKRMAFRLETLPQYLVDEEKVDFRAYLDGEPISDNMNRDWVETISKAISVGKRVSRVHLLPLKPTPYLRYQIEWGYPYSAKAGEEIRFLMPDAPQAVREQATRDFWLFDDGPVVLMSYDEEGRFQGRELERGEERVKHYVAMRELFLSHSVPFRHYLANIRNS